MVAHLAVVSLVAAAGVAGLSATAQTGAEAGHFAGSAPFVTTVYGVVPPSEEFATSRYDTRDAVNEKAAILDRSARSVLPTSSAPLPEPVAVDPDATPLPAPAVGSTSPATTGVTTTTRAPAPAPSALVWPVPAGSVSQYYHAGHLALDIAAPYGSQVSAAQAGVVTSAGWRNNGGGYVISIDHGNGMVTVYNHLGSLWVSAGQSVGAGQGIGGVGCTGMCTGPHVHFEVIVNGVIDNPLRYL